MMYGEFYFWFSNRLIKGIITEQCCWQPVGRSKDKKGYNWFWFRGKMTKLHRTLYKFLNGNIPDNFYVRHICDNPTCINPEHLLAGTAQDNSDDKKRHGHQGYGEEIRMAKLTDAKVEAILNSNSTQMELAREYCVSQSVISRIKNGKTWKHIRRPTNWVPKRSKLDRMQNKPSLRNSQPNIKNKMKKENI